MTKVYKAALEKLLADVEATMKAKTGEDGKPLGFQMVGKRIVPLGNSTAQTEMSVTDAAPTCTVLAFGAKDVSLDVLVGNSAATTMRSPFQRDATSKPPTPRHPEGRDGDRGPNGQPRSSDQAGRAARHQAEWPGCAAYISFLEAPRGNAVFGSADNFLQEGRRIGRF